MDIEFKFQRFITFSIDFEFNIRASKEFAFLKTFLFLMALDVNHNL